MDYIKISENLLDLLENNYIKYYDTLCNLKDTYDTDTIKKIVDYDAYRTYFGNHLHSLIYLTGDLKELPPDNATNFYGYNSVIPEDFAIKIFNKLLEYNVNVYQLNYYNQNPLQNIMCDSCLTQRINNNKLKKLIKNKYIRDLDITLIK